MSTSVAESPYGPLNGADLLKRLEEDWTLLQEAMLDLIDGDIDESERERIRERIRLFLNKRVCEHLYRELQSTKDSEFKSRKLKSLGNQLKKLHKSIENGSKPREKYLRSALATLYTSIETLDYYDRASPKSKILSDLWNNDDQFARFRALVAKLKLRIDTLGQIVEAETLDNLRAWAHPSQEAQPTSPLQRRLEAMGRSSGLRNVTLADSLSKASHVCLPFEAGNYRRASLYFS